MRILAATVSVLALATAPALGDQKFPATLAGHAMLPAKTFVQPPADAPDFFKISGRFTAPDGKRVDTLEAIDGTSFLSAKDAPRKTGIALPFAGQPVQGFSGIKRMQDGTFWVLVDNGFGAKANSADAMLMMHRVAIDWAGGKVDIRQTLFLHDPDRLIPFQIAMEGTAKRYLTGADLDIESFQTIGGAIYIGDEFGPYLVRVDGSGKVTGFWETMVDNKPARSPDHYRVATPAVPGPAPAFTVRRSRGFEGMAASPDGKFLYPLLEGPVWDEAKKDWEKNADGKEYLRVLEFDVAKGAWTGRSWKYTLEINGNNIGDFNMISPTMGLIVERDNGEGDAAHACAAGKVAADCFNVPAKFKRVYKIGLTDATAGGFARKVGHIDLLDIADPNKVAKTGAEGGKFTFPFVTIENVDIVDAEHIVVGNDNNLPYSSGRKLGKQDDNELILLRVPEFLQAK